MKDLLSQGRQKESGVTATARGDCTAMLYRRALCLHRGGERSFSRITTTEPFNCKTEAHEGSAQPRPSERIRSHREAGTSGATAVGSLRDVDPNQYREATIAGSPVAAPLSLTQSEIHNIGSIKVEGIINPTNADIDLKEDVGECDLHRTSFETFQVYTVRFNLSHLCLLDCFSSQ
ncbi:UNVERIFIED_CONTAM: hypothetical protein FKN15_078373 [Acipenser sinensis]